MKPDPILEVCVDAVEAAKIVEAAGADRIELCGNLAAGGTTPSMGLINRCVDELSIPVFVMIRPRGGDFCYTDSEFATMKAEVELVVAAGAAGIVFGMLNPDGTINEDQTAELVQAAQGLPCTFHRAIDVCKKPLEAVTKLEELGISRILSSGQQANAWDGRELLKQMVELSTTMTIMPGSGVNASNIQELAAFTQAKEFHFSASLDAQSTMIHRNAAVSFQAQPKNEWVIPQGNAEKVIAIRTALGLTT